MFPSSVCTGIYHQKVPQAQESIDVQCGVTYQVYCCNLYVHGIHTHLSAAVSIGILLLLLSRRGMALRHSRYSSTSSFAVLCIHTWYMCLSSHHAQC